MCNVRTTCVVAAAALIIVASGCNAGNENLSPMGPQSLTTHGRTLGPGTRRTTWAKSVFVSDHFVGKVYQFADRRNGPVLGTITDSKGPLGLDMDSSGNLYVAAEGDYAIKVYAPGSYSATSTLSDPGEFISSVAVCPNGTVYAANEFGFSQKPGDVAIFAPGAKSPTGTVPDANIYSAAFATCDANNVLWFTYSNFANEMQVASYNGVTVTEYGNLHLGTANSASGIRALKTGKLAMGNTYVGLNLYHDSPRKNDPTRPLGCRVGSAITFSFDRSDKQIYEVDSSSSIEKCDISGKQLYTIGQGTLDTADDVYAFPGGNN
ncbi:MAG: hypothetical protein JOZ77_12575 [Candidatus Eremiobacteraeota bacterium]|nr:hypothetical protein [Candidatus Eremiobacteraeota bacterium]